MTGGRPSDKPTWLRYSGVGFEFAAALVVFALIGYWIDRTFGTEPWGLVIGAALGLIGGTYNLIREATSAFRSFDQNKGRKRADDDDESRD